MFMKKLRSIYQFMQNSEVDGVAGYITKCFNGQLNVHMYSFKNKQALGLYKDGKRLFELSFDINDNTVTLHDAAYDSDGCLRVNANKGHTLSIDSPLDELDKLKLYSIDYFHQLIEGLPECTQQVMDIDLSYTSVIVFDGQNSEYSYAIISKDESNVILYRRGTDISIILKDKRGDDDKLIVLHSMQFEFPQQVYHEWYYLIGMGCRKDNSKYFDGRIVGIDMFRLSQFIKSAEKDIGHLIGNNKLC